MNRKDRIIALELEIHGIDSELAIKCPEHARLTRVIEDLEADKQKLRYELLRHRAILRTGGDNDQVA